MKKLGLMMAATMAATMAGAAAHATVLDYTFSPDASITSATLTYAIEGTFDFNTETSQIYDYDIHYVGGGLNQRVLDAFTRNNNTALLLHAGTGQIEYFLSGSLDNGGSLALKSALDGRTALKTTGSVFIPSAVSAAPEPSVWALMLAGVAMIGLTLRQGRRQRGMALAA